MPNPTGKNQYSKGGGKGKKKAPSLSAGRKKVSRAGVSGKLTTDRRMGARSASQKASSSAKSRHTRYTNT